MKAAGAENLPLNNLAESTANLICHELQNAWGSEAYGAATGHGVSSSKIQALLSPTLLAKGFQTEVPAKIGLAGFKADFGLITESDGILVEIERGKTTDNNMDMIDFWKCHIHPKAHHLILVVPVWYRTKKSLKRTFFNVQRRMQPLFEPGNETNVKSLHIVGY